MIARNAIVLALLCVLALTSCTTAGVATPTPTTAPVPTSAMVVPVTTATTPVTLTLPAPASTPVIAARQEGAPAAILTGIRLQPGRQYRLSVTSSAGAVAFSGTWSQSAVGQDGLPGIKTGNMEGTAPATFEIVPPVASVAKDWVYSASVSNKTGGSITLTILQVAP